MGCIKHQQKSKSWFVQRFQFISSIYWYSPAVGSFSSIYLGKVRSPSSNHLNILGVEITIATCRASPIRERVFQS